MIRTVAHAATIRSGPADLDLALPLGPAADDSSRRSTGSVRAPEVPAASRDRGRNTTRRRRTAAARS